MKIIISALLFVNIIIYDQEYDDPQVSKCELNFQLFNNNQRLIEFVTYPVYIYTDYCQSHSNLYYPYSGCNFVTIPTWNGSYIIELLGFTNYCVDNGFDYSISTPGDGGCSGYPNYSRLNFQSGIYKIIVKVGGVEKTYFYYDNRHSQFPHNTCSLPGFLGNDICIRYDVLNNKLYYKFGLTSNPDMYGFDSLKKSEVINWWELGTTFGYDVSGYQTRFFAVLNTPVSINNAPYLSWQAPNVSDPVLHYKIQRSWYPNDFYTIATTNNTNYHDLDIFWNSNSTNNTQFVQYRIVTVFQNVSFPYEFSNTQKLFVNKGLQKDGIDNISEFSFSLDQNYPNPFNPVTKISVTNRRFCILKGL